MKTVDKSMVTLRIQQRLNELGLTANAASQMAGRNREWWGQVIRKPALWPTTDNLIALCGAIGLRVNFALFGSGARLVDDPDIGDDTRLIPLVSWVAASNFADAESITASEVDRYIPVTGLDDGDYIALDVKGDSMNLIAPDGSVIVANRRDKNLVDKKFYVIATENGGETTFKQYRSDFPPRLAPYSSNLDHQAINIQEPMRVVGRVTRVINEI